MEVIWKWGGEGLIWTQCEDRPKGLSRRYEWRTTIDGVDVYRSQTTVGLVSGGVVVTTRAREGSVDAVARQLASVAARANPARAKQAATAAGGEHG